MTALLAAASGIPARVRAEEAADDGEDDDQSAGVVLDNAAFEQRLAQSEALVRNAQPTVQVGGYVDFGFFVPQGNGSGYVEDFGHVYFPGYAGQFGWVFLGDILAPAINTRGEVADLGPAPGVNRYDSINSRGAPGFVLNEVNVALRSALTPTALVSASINFTPRTGSDFALGDAFDVDIAQVEWLPTDSQRTSIFVGKMDPVFGIEYRDRKSDRRFGITPSLMARYTIGTALGLKLRTKFGNNDRLVLAVALTNGSNTTEQFHFYDELDSNAGKTGSARLSIKLPLCDRDRRLGQRRPARSGDRHRALDVVLRRRPDGALGALRSQGPVDAGARRRRAVTGRVRARPQQRRLPGAGHDADAVAGRPRPRRVPRRVRLARHPAGLPDQGRGAPRWGCAG